MSDVGKEVVLKGWVHRHRDHGGLEFIDLRDRTGMCQVVLDPAVLSAEDFAKAGDIRDEFVVAIQGEVTRRPAGTENPNLATGEIEIRARKLVILNPAAVTPFKIGEFSSVSEDVRLRYRYLDLRRPEMQHKIFTRSKLYEIVRNHLYEQGFIEVETPILTKSTPEGARDFLVPSRLNPGMFYALPQSPQLFKQILMVAGYDKYFQIARCFRDEDFRANRQPEFTQIDVEMSFITPDDLFEVIEGLMQRVFKGTLDIDVPIPFPRMSYKEAILKYGNDKPDVRFDLPISDVTEALRSGCEFEVLRGVLERGGVIRGLCVPGAGTFSRKQIDDLTHFVFNYGAKGLTWFKATEKGLESSMAKFFTADTLARIQKTMAAQPGDLLLIVADQEKVVCDSLANLRLHLGRELNLIDAKEKKFLWVVDFPLLDWNEKENRWDPMHHPFTSPVPEDVPLLDSAPGKVRAYAYDLVLNGEEIGGGSIRIHRRDVQQKVFQTIGITPEQAERKFGFLLEALSFGSPPHGGIALGFDRLVMIIVGDNNIREVIAFPKTQSGVCLMTAAPSEVDAAQLKELSVRTTGQPKP